MLVETFGGGPAVRLKKVSGYPTDNYVQEVSSIKLLILSKLDQVCSINLKTMAYQHDETMADLTKRVAHAFAA
jgi:hypothetical protein